MALSLLVILALALAGCNSTTADGDSGGGGGKKGGRGKGGGGGPVPVVVANATQKDVPIEIPAVGNVEAIITISIRAQISGQLMEVLFQEGDYVKKGEKLFTIDARPYEAALAQAEANVAKDVALLGQAQANLARDTAQQKYARATADRYEKLKAEGVVSQDQSEQQNSNADALGQGMAADRAAIESAKAQIEADKASINNLNVQLSYTTISAPLEGRTGAVGQKPGNIVTANTTEMTTLNQVSPIYVTFAVPEARLAEVKRYMALGTLDVTALAQDGSGVVDHGQLSFVDNSVDTTTGTIKLKGTFLNPERKLWPGQFVNVTLRLTTRGGAVVVPNQAVQTGQDGTFVYVVKEDRTVEARPVVTGPRVDLDLVIDKGLAAGETVVTDGQLRLQPGSRVQFRGGDDDGVGGGKRDSGGKREGGKREGGKRDGGNRDSGNDQKDGKSI
ncbi:MAG TPA: efflux RND transporter periplasmic adaptor subunit [Bryobacteraceae bacterium]|nr:efflux RND transporter periplasmic adaptor subunit [Bryobacteraceae bacterium]